MIFLLNNRKEILIQHRSPSKATFPDMHDASSTFHITFGESYDDGAKRELFEETGIKAGIKFIGKFIHHDSPEYQVVAVYFCRSDSQVVIDPKETSSAEFLPRAEVDRIVKLERVPPWLREGWKILGKYADKNNLFGDEKRVKL
jgi:isopentenyldiphosphate isomerase